MTFSFATIIRTRCILHIYSIFSFHWSIAWNPSNISNQHNLKIHADVGILLLVSVYPPTLSPNPSSKMRNNSLVLLKYLRIFSQPSNTFSLDLTNICSWLLQQDIPSWVHSMAYIYTQKDNRFFLKVSMLNPFSTSSMYLSIKIKHLFKIYLYRPLFSKYLT